MRSHRLLEKARGEGGSALLLVLLVTIAVSSLALTAVTMAGNSRLINAYEQRQGELEAAADAGIELARARLNANPALFPAEGYAAVEERAPVRDASGAIQRGLWRSIYIGPVGSTTGQFGNFGNIVVVAGDASSDRVIRRTDIREESFAKFAYFTNVEPANIAFGSGDYITGPVHSNDAIQIYSTGATFQGPVSTHETFVNRRFATFLAGYTEGASEIPMPTTRQLQELQDRAAEGGASFSGSNGGSEGQARVRIEFVALDIDGEPGTTGEDEGFFRVYILNNESSAGREWLVADLPGEDRDQFATAANRNCGVWNGNDFMDLGEVAGLAAWGATTTARRRNALTPGSGPLPGAMRRCYLGGANELNPTDALAPGGQFTVNALGQNGQFVPNDGSGSWQLYSNTPDPRVVAAAGPVQARYLFPLGHNLNPNFKGVIHVSHKVAVSGVLRGKVTLASPDNIIIVDDLVYATDPGAGTCADMLGLFSGEDIVIADNMLNTPQDPGTGNRTYEESPGDERINGILLSLSQVYVENFGSDPTSGQSCDGISRGRGCLRLTGGIIQEQRGAVGQTSGSGYIKRYGYDACAAQYPPPYFPTTGKYQKVGIYEMDPTGFDLGQVFD